MVYVRSQKIVELDRYARPPRLGYVEADKWQSISDERGLWTDRSGLETEDQRRGERLCRSAV
jgi:hypothetical protein